MKQVLLVYYSQTGQLSAVVDSLIEPLIASEDIQVNCLKIDPIPAYTFPWKTQDFFEEFPETVLEFPCMIKPLNIPKTHYDLIILAYQPWYLSISRPMNAFLQTAQAKTLLGGCEVVTVIGCRNMWTQAQEQMKGHLKALNAKLVGNIVLRDRAYNLVSVYTILRWMLKGKKGHSGISESDIKHCEVFGQYIHDRLISNQPIKQQDLLALGAVKVIASLMFLEKRAIILFRGFARFILKKGAHGSSARRLRLGFFKGYLLLAILILSPIATILVWILQLFFNKTIKDQIHHHEGV